MATIQGVYLALFGRPADPIGLAFFNTATNNGANLTAIGDLARTQEYVDRFAGQTPVQIINSVYQSLFNRDAEPAGLTFWANALSTGRFNINNIAIAILDGAQGTDLALLNNKLAAANAFTTAIDTTAEILGYQGNAAAASGRAFLSGITTTTPPTQAAVDAAVAAATSGGSGQTFNLTVGIDSFTGGNGADTFNAPMVGTTPAASLTALDTLDGGAGNDTLNVTETGAINTTALGGLSIKNIETANLTAAGAVTTNTTGWTGLTGLNITASAGAVNATSAAATNVTVNGVAVAANNISVTGGNNVTVNSAGGTSGSITVTNATGVVTVSDTSATFANTTDTTLGAINVTGGSSVTVTQTSGTAGVALAANNFTAKQGDITVNGTAATKTVTITQDAAVGAVNGTGATGKIGVATGDVSVSDANAASTTAAGSITTVSLTNFNNALVNSGALTTLNLGGTGVNVNAGTLGALTTPANTALALNLNALKATGNLTIDDDIQTLNVTGSGGASTIANVIANGAKAVNIAGDAAVTFTANTLNALQSVTVTNTAGGVVGTVGADVTFTGGAGKDGVTLSNAFTKVIDMGAGDDRVGYGGAAAVNKGSVNAGEGTDTIAMSAAQAATASADSVFNSTFKNFEVLDIATGANNAAINLAGINGVSSVVTRGVNGGQAVDLNSFATNGTLTLDAASAGRVNANITNAALNPADVVNVRLSNNTGGAVTFGTVGAAGVETVNIAMVDAGTGANTAATVDVLTLVAADATKIVVSGNDGLNLTNTGNVKVTTFDASGVVGNGTDDTAANLAVTFTSANTTATATVSITGGEGNDVLTGNAAKDTIVGGAGGDTISGAGGLDTLTGGAGRDIFVLGATVSGDRDVVTDFTVGATGDQIRLTDANTTLAGGGPVVTADTATAAASNLAYALGGGVTTANADVIVLQNGASLTTGANGGDLTASTNGSELLKALTNSDAADAYSGITTAAASQTVYLLAYQGGNAYLYLGSDGNGNSSIEAGEIQLIGTLNGVAANSLVAANFTALV